MLKDKREHPKVKPGLHPRNKHRERYNFPELTASYPDLAPFVKRNEYDDDSVDFFDPEAVKALNKALLKHFYNVQNWDVPPHYLCPPIPGRADYIHHVADLLAYFNAADKRQIPTGSHIKCLDIGTGANCIYPIIGHQEYGWSFVATDIDTDAIESAQQILAANPALQAVVECRIQPNPRDVFHGIIQEGEFYDISISNPPFHASQEEAQSGTLRKLRNLKHTHNPKPILNFGGQSNELWCEGGEERFITNMIYQSKHYARSCCWFTTLISRETTLNKLYPALEKVEAADIHTITVSHGNKSSRILAWTFLTPTQMEYWTRKRWQQSK
jgi:23S rRNA (adenine1618-N6)-methyltransferase